SRAPRWKRDGAFDHGPRCLWQAGRASQPDCSKPQKRSCPRIGKAALYGHDSPWAHDFEMSSKSLGVALEFFQADEHTLETAFAAMAADGVQGVVVTSDGVYVPLGKVIAEGAIKYRLPTIFPFREHVRAGGFLAYAARITDLSRRS